MLLLRDLNIVEYKDDLAAIPQGKVLINTINAHSYNTAQKDELFAEALKNGDYLIPDGASIVKACRWLKAKSQPRERIAGWDLFEFEMRSPLQLPQGGEPQREVAHIKTNSIAFASGEPQREETHIKTSSDTILSVEPQRKRRVMFMGSSESVLAKIRQRAADSFPNVEVITYSPPYKPEFSKEDNEAIIKAINEANPDLLWIGMTAPKQEKWAYEHWDELNIHCHVGTIGAVFDFFAGTTKRAPLWWQQHSLEWLYRLIKEPKRMWRRYLIGNALFLWNMIKEKFFR
ncbi:MAG: WecB/TagA/CpsF family glycosyltransferase [Prevotella sp.]